MGYRADPPKIIGKIFLYPLSGAICKVEFLMDTKVDGFSLFTGEVITIYKASIIGQISEENMHKYIVDLL